MEDEYCGRPAPKERSLSGIGQKPMATSLEVPAKKTGRSRSKAQREFDRKARAAKKFPHGPEAKELAQLEPTMPQSLRSRIARSDDHPLWREGFEWMAARLRMKVRDGKRFYPKNVIKDLGEAYPMIVLHDEDLEWLESWLGYLKQFPAALRSKGKYGPRVIIVDALGAEVDIFFSIDNLDQPPAEKSDLSAPLPTTELSIGELQAPPRDMPFRFKQFSSSTAETFWRAYWKSSDIHELREAGKVLASDPVAKDELRKLGTEAEHFFIQTMAKLRIPLS
ncbi:hypothetical protein LCM18_02965 [Qipengyuania flava]|nr:hypothetical protein LCM18_02965 [Qipengyuania flava]